MKKYARWFWQQMRDVRKQVALRIVAGLSQVGLGLFLVWLCRRFIDYVIWNGDIAYETIVLFGVIAVLIGLRLVVYYLTNMSEVVQQNAIRKRLFGKVLWRKMYSDKVRMHSGDVSQRLDRDISAVASITTGVLPSMVVTLVQLVGAFLLMRHIDSMLAWSLLVLTPAVVVCAKYLSHKLKKMTHDIRKEESRIQMLIQETVEHQMTIKALEGEASLAQRESNMQARLQRLTFRRVRFTLISRMLLGFTFSFGYFGAFVYGAIQLRDGLITFGVMTAFLQLVSQIQNPILTLLGMIPQMIHSAASADRLMEIEQMEQECEEQTEGILAHRPAAHRYGVRLTDVTCGYPGESVPVLHAYSHDFQPGTSSALLGETGRGKTTLLRLVCGMLMPQSGRVVLYDDEGREVSGVEMRKHIVYIPQGNTLMSGSVRDNLMLARPDATDEDLRLALHTAMADFVYGLSEGLDTLIGEHATRLSEGQAQRIAIARGLLREGSVVLLDEISSSLDAATEKELFVRMFKNYSDKTIICVTHREEATKHCGEVVSL